MRYINRIINDLLIANTECGINTFDNVNNSNSTFLYIDAINGDDSTASTYFTTNTLELNNISSPFKTYSGVSGAIEYIKSKTSDTRFTVNTLFIVDNTEQGKKVWLDTVPTNTIGTDARRLIWVGFEFEYVTFFKGNVFMHSKLTNTPFQFISPNVDNIDSCFFYSDVNNGIMADMTSINGYNLNCYKSKMFFWNGGFGGSYPKKYNFINCTYKCFGRWGNGLYEQSYINFRLGKVVNSIIIDVAGSISGSSITSTVTEFTHNISQSNLYGGYDLSNLDLDSTCIFNVDPKFVDVDNNVYYTESTSPATKTGTNGIDIGIGHGFNFRNSYSNSLIGAISNGTLQNMEFDALGYLYVLHTDFNAVSGTTNTLKLNNHASTLDDYYNALKVRLFNTVGTNIGEYDITDYDGTTQTITIATTFAETPDNTFTYSLSGMIESTVIDYSISIDKLSIFENKTLDKNGNVLHGVYSLEMKTCNVGELVAGNIPNAYKKYELDYVRVDISGNGSADVGYDDATGVIVSSDFEQVKFGVW